MFSKLLLPLDPSKRLKAATDYSLTLARRLKLPLVAAYIANPAKTGAGSDLQDPEKCFFPLGERELKLLFKRTEGWITALHLAALALSRNTDREGFLRGLSGTERNIADYLAEDVLASLPADLQLFLDQTSVLDEFNAELCNALTGRRDGLDMLMRLQNEQLFVIALDDQREWFRYHHLFAEFLQGRLSRHADPTPLLHAAARWCEGRDLADRAIKYALRARDYLFAAELLERQGARLIAGNRVYGILGMLNGIPAEVIREHPVFQIFYAWQLAFEQRPLRWHHGGFDVNGH